MLHLAELTPAKTGLHQQPSVGVLAETPRPGAAIIMWPLLRIDRPCLVGRVIPFDAFTDTRGVHKVGRSQVQILSLLAAIFSHEIIATPAANCINGFFAGLTCLQNLWQPNFHIIQSTKLAPHGAIMGVQVVDCSLITAVVNLPLELKMKIRLPYRRRLLGKSSQPQASSRSHDNKWSEWIKSGVASFFGASLASLLTLWITLATLESFKAEENLRQLALNDLYRPLVKSTSECNSNRIKLLNSLARYEGWLKIASGYLTEFSNNSRADEIGEILMPTSKNYGEFVDKVMDSLDEVGKYNTIVAACERENMDGWMTLSIVVGVDEEFSKIAEIRLKAMSGLEGPIRDDDMFLQLIINPKSGMSVLFALSDGMNGNQSRALAVVDKLKFELKKSSDHASKVYKQQEELYLSIMRSDNELNRLFLRNLRSRFSKTPTSYIE